MSFLNAKMVTAKRLTDEQIQQALKMSELGMVMMPLKNKFPGGLSGWQGLTQSYEGHLWGDATGFGIQTGKRSGVTVIDVDKPSREWFDKFWAQSGLQPTTTVETPSGGLHLYYKYDERLKQTQGFGKIDIDIRNDGGLIVAPGSPYDTKKPDKVKFIGINYEWAKDEEGVVLDWSKMRELDEIWVEFQQHGIDQETFKPKEPVVCAFGTPPRRKPKKKKKLEPPPVMRATEDKENAAVAFMDLMMVYAQHNGCGYKAWREGVWSWTAYCDEHGLDAQLWADRWSQRIEGYDGPNAVAQKIAEYRNKATNRYGESFIMMRVPGGMRGTAGCCFRR